MAEGIINNRTLVVTNSDTFCMTLYAPKYTPFSPQYVNIFNIDTSINITKIQTNIIQGNADAGTRTWNPNIRATKADGSTTILCSQTMDIPPGDSTWTNTYTITNGTNIKALQFWAWDPNRLRGDGNSYIKVWFTV